MRKLFMFLALTALATFGLSCGSDDKPEVKSLVLTPSATSVEVGAEVSFTVTDGKNAVVGAVIKGDKGASVSAGKFKATKAGDYSFSAKKSGFKESNVVKITVKNKNGGTVEEPVEEVKELKLSVVTPKDEILFGGSVKLKVVNEKNENVENAVLKYKGEILPSEGQMEWTKSNSEGEIVIPSVTEEGEYKFSVVKDGVESNEVTFVVPAMPDPVVSKGSLKYDGVEYKIDKTTIVYEGKGKLPGDDKTVYAKMSIVSENNSDNYVSVVIFLVPAVEGENFVTLLNKAGKIEKIAMLGKMLPDGKAELLGVDQSDVVIDFNVKPGALYINGDYNLTAKLAKPVPEGQVSPPDKDLTIDFNGDFDFEIKQGGQARFSNFESIDIKGEIFKSYLLNKLK